MKKSYNNLPLVAIISLFLMISVNKVTLSQPPAPPQDSFGSQFNNSGNDADAAPIGEGIWILIALAASYGVNRYMRKMEVNSENQLLQLSDEDIIKHIGNTDQNQIIQNSGFVEENQI